MTDAEVEKKPIEVLYRDDYIAVVNKPAGLMAHSSALARGEDDFLHDRLREQFDCKIYLIHRLDRATSGCLLIAFDNPSASALGKQFMTRDVEKNYLAICRGWPEESFTVDYDLDGGPGKPEKKTAITEFKRLATAEIELASAHHESSRYALMQCTPYTGRFRQIRRHLKHLSHHLIGDTSHGDGRHNRNFRMMGVHRMLLHAHKLVFNHPVTAKRLEVMAGLDGEFIKALQLLKMESI
ncbi:MAG: pseudouridine synthase [Methylococcales bacterium]